MADKFVFAPIDVFQDHRLTLMQTRVLLALFSFRSKNSNTVHPHRSTLADRVGYSEKVISRTTTQLVKQGWLVKTGNGGRNRPATYEITTPDFELIAQETVTDTVTDTESVTVTDQGLKGLPNQSLNGYRSGAETVTDPVRGIELTNNLEELNSNLVPATTPEAREPKKPITAETWEAYSNAYFNRYGVNPIRNKTVNSQMVNFVQRIGVVESPGVAAYYVESNNAFYAGKGHSVGMLVYDAEKLRMEWATGHQLTSGTVRQADKKQTSYNAIEEAIQISRAREETNERADNSDIGRND